MTTPAAVAQFRADIVDPALRYLGLWSEAASNLVVGTAVYESGLAAFRQIPVGPALGFWQIEPPTLADTLDRLRTRRPELHARLDSMASPWPPDKTRQVVGGLFYAAGVCRVKYWLDPAPLPAADDIEALATYYRRVWNTPLGKATVAGWVERYRAVCA